MQWLLPILTLSLSVVFFIIGRLNAGDDCSLGRIELIPAEIDKKHSYAIFPYKNNNHIFYDYSEINQKGSPIRKTLLK